MCISFISSLHKGHFPFSASLFYTCQFANSQLKICSPVPLICIATDYFHLLSLLLFPVPIRDYRSLVSNFFVFFLSLNIIAPSFHYFTYFKSLPSVWNQKYPSPVFYSSSLRIATQLPPFRSVIYHALQGFNNSWLEDGSHGIWKLDKELKGGTKTKSIGMHLAKPTGEELKCNKQDDFKRCSDITMTTL